VEWVCDDRMVIEAFDDYWGERGNVDRVVFRPITEDGTRLLSFEAGEIDLFHGQVTPGEVPRLEATDGITVTRSAGLGHAYLGFNFRNETLANDAVRRAMAHLIPSEGIVARVLNGIGTLGVGPISPESIAAYQQIQRLLMSDVPFAFFNDTEEIGVVHDWVDGWSVHPYASATFQDLHLVTETR